MINRAVLTGRLTKAPELKYTQSGIAVTNFILAVNRPFKNEEGENEADFIRIVAWRKQAENAATFLTKGSLVGIDGRIQTRNFEGQDGQRVYVTEVVADSIQFLEPRNKDDQVQKQSYSQQPGFKSPRFQQKQPQQQPSPYQDIDVQDDDLPF